MAPRICPHAFALAFVCCGLAACSGGGDGSPADPPGTTSTTGLPTSTSSSAQTNTAVSSTSGGPNTSTATSTRGTDGGPVGTTGTTSSSGIGGSTSTNTSTASTGGTSTIPDDGDRSPEGVCARWNTDRADTSEGTWSGNIASCDPGDISDDGRQNALRLFNLYRWLADLPTVETEPSRNEQAQACALMMDANDALSHDPPQSWTCYTELGAQGAATSNISSGPGVQSVDGYMIDTGNETTMGHRRIILSNWLGPIGLGSTGQGGSSCMQNIGGTGKAGKPWVAWPPAGAFPIQAYSFFRTSYSDTGWSVQSEDMNLSGAQVTVTSGGNNLAVDVSPLTGNYGSTSGIRIVPSGWDVEAGATYAVSVTGIDSPIDYELMIVDCE